MKDKRLEKEFEEYFQAVNIPNDITADAKAAVRPKRSIMPKIVKFASIAASIVLVFAVTLTIMFSNRFKKSDGEMSGTPSSPDYSGDLPNNGEPEAPGHSSGSSGGDGSFGPDLDSSSGSNPSYPFELYTDSDLVHSDISAYSLSSVDKSLKFIENFAYANNASVETCRASYIGGQLKLVRAQVSILNGLTRDDTTVFVEFTAENLVYDELADYYDGDIYSYYGAKYYLTQTTAENGEPEFKLHILYKGIKYYFNVHSSDEKAYEKYLQLVTNKNF